LGTGYAEGESVVRKNGRVRLFNQKCDDKFLKRLGKVLTLEGVYHHNMITRATNENYRVKFPTYKDVTVSENFKDFQFFANWCNNQVGFGINGFVLEKDLLVPNNKVYSEDTCVFVPDVINSFLTFNKIRQNGLPVGVSWSSTEDCYKSYCAQLNGKNKTLGRFTNPKDAFAAYCKFKEAMAQKLVETYFGQIDARAIEALSSFKVEKYTKEVL